MIVVILKIDFDQKRKFSKKKSIVLSILALLSQMNPLMIENNYSE
jgi:hypothetical protein